MMRNEFAISPNINEQIGIILVNLAWTMKVKIHLSCHPTENINETHVMY